LINYDYQQLSINRESDRPYKNQIVTNNHQLLVLRRDPLWAWGEITGALIFWTAGLLLNYCVDRFHSLTQRPFSFAILLFFCVSVIQIFQILRVAKIKTYTFDKSVCELTIDSRNIWKRQTAVYPLQECQGAVVESVPANQFWIYYQIILLLNEEETVPLTELRTVRRLPSETIADTINQFLET
jgi:hypothetical protein